MPTTAADLPAQALTLTPLERLHLADKLADKPHDSLAEADEAAFAADLRRRMEESDRDPSVRIPWEQVREMR